MWTVLVRRKFSSRLDPATGVLCMQLSIEPRLGRLRPEWLKVMLLEALLRRLQLLISPHKDTDGFATTTRMKFDDCLLTSRAARFQFKRLYRRRLGGSVEDCRRSWSQNQDEDETGLRVFFPIRCVTSSSTAVVSSLHLPQRENLFGSNQN